MKLNTRKLALMAGLAGILLGGGNVAMADSWKHGPSRGSHSDQRYKNNNFRDQHDWHKGHNNHYHAPKRVYYPPRHYYAPPPRQTVIYYNTSPYYPQTYYRETYVQPYATYVVGGYLPKDRHWRPLRNHVRYGLKPPGHGQRWVYADRDALLISEATSRIVSGIVLAAAID